MAIGVRMDLTKLKAALQRITKEEGDRAITRLTQSDLKTIGLATIQEMKIAIAKGISPIEGDARFPAYKWARASKSERAGKYPWSEQKNHPDKKIRPVNLSLSGDFLDALEARPKRGGVEVGFWNRKFEKYEKGHREGANGQPSRPIIPDDTEKFSRSILRRIENAVKDIFRKK
jgi:hypothetical protein